jgi:tellurite resistance protein
MVYICDSRRRQTDEPAAVDLALPFASASMPPTGRELPYWPSYSGLNPNQRRLYLQWLAGNRSTTPPELGYSFLFFYNLERRALIEREDIGPVFKEVCRLRALYATSGQQVSGSWQGYTSRLLWFLLLAHKQHLTSNDLREFARETKCWSDESLAMALAGLLNRDERLTSTIAYSVAAWLPDSMRSIVQRRVPGELEALFRQRFREQFPDGLEIRTGAAKRESVYRPASNILPPIEVTFPDPLGIRSQFKPLSKIWNACIDDLKKLGTLSSKLGIEIDQVKRWEALPDALRAGTEHPLTEEFCKLVDSRADEAGQSILPVSELASVLEVEGAGKLTLGRCRRLCQTAEQIGFFLEPDARLTGRAYRQDEQVMAFLKMSTSPVDLAKYGPAACMLQFGFLVASSDGEAEEREMRVISQHIESAFELQEDEVRRLERLRVLLQRTGPDRPLLKRLVKGLGKLQRQAIAKLLVALVLADGIVTKEERKALQSACNLLNVAYYEIEKLLPPADDDPVSVSAAKKGAPGERLPAPPEQRFALNKSAIAAILSETRDVAQMLAKAMASEEPEDIPKESEVPIPVPSSSGATVPVAAPATSSDGTVPPAKYAKLHEALLAQERWLMTDAESLARSHRMMLSGALDALNEWAVEVHGGQLFVEEGEYLVVERSLII